MILVSTTSWSFIGQQLVADGFQWYAISILWSTIAVDVFQYTSPDTNGQLVGDQSATSRPPVATSRLLVGDNQYKLVGSAKTCRPPVGEWSPMGGDLRAMVGDSPTISMDLLPTDCGPPVVLPDDSPTTMSVTATFYLWPWSPMVFGGQRPFSS